MCRTGSPHISPVHNAVTQPPTEVGVCATQARHTTTRLFTLNQRQLALPFTRRRCSLAVARVCRTVSCPKAVGAVRAAAVGTGSTKRGGGDVCLHCDRLTVLPFLSHHTSQYNSLYMYVYMYMYMSMSYHSYLGGLHFRLLSHSHARRSHAPDETRLIRERSGASHKDHVAGRVLLRRGPDLGWGGLRVGRSGSCLGAATQFCLSGYRLSGRRRALMAFKYA